MNHSPNSVNNRLSYIPALEGIRGYALLCVLSVHAYWVLLADGTPKGFREAILHHSPRHIVEAGWAAIDLFFVLSGFLITTILLRAKGENGFIRRYYLGRCRRILPLYYALILFTVVIVPHLEGIVSPHPNIIRWWPFILGLQNLYPDVWGSYFLGSTWSLAVEIQLYAVWPWLILYTSIPTLRKILIWLVLMIPVLKIIFGMLPVHQMFLYFLTIFRLDTFSWGALLAVVIIEFSTKPALLRRIVLFATLVVLPVTLATLISTDPFGPVLGRENRLLNVGIYTGLGFGFAGAIGSLVLFNNRFVSAVFGNPFATFLGRISYSAYLIHLGVFMNLMLILKQDRIRSVIGSSYLLQGSMLFSVTLIMAAIVWFFLERPFLKMRNS